MRCSPTTLEIEFSEMGQKKDVSLSENGSSRYSTTSSWDEEHGGLRLERNSRILHHRERAVYQTASRQDPPTPCELSEAYPRTRDMDGRLLREPRQFFRLCQHWPAFVRRSSSKLLCVHSQGQLKRLPSCSYNFVSLHSIIMASP